MITMYNWPGHARPPGRGSTKVGADRSVPWPRHGGGRKKNKNVARLRCAGTCSTGHYSHYTAAAGQILWQTTDYTCRLPLPSPGFYTAGTRDIIDRSGGGGGECPLSTVHCPLHSTA